MATRLRFVLVLALLFGVAFAYLGCSSSTSSGDDDSADDDDNDDQSPTTDDDDDDQSPADDDDDASPVPPQYNWAVETVAGPGYQCEDSSLSGSEIRCHALAFTSTGSPVVAFYDDAAGGGLNVAYKTGSGTAWTTDAVETATDTGRDPSVAVDKTGRIGVAYFNVSTKDLMCAFKPEGGAWTITTVATNVGGFLGIGGWPTLKFDAKNKANVMGFNANSGDIFYYTEGASGTWTSADIFSQLADTKAPDFEFDSKGLPGMAWQVEQNNFADEVTFYGTYDLVKTAKDTQVDSEAVTGTNNYFAFAFDATDVPHIFFNVGSPMQVIMAVNTSGSTWHETAVPDTSDQLYGPIEARLGSDGAVWVSYACQEPLTPRLGRLADGGWTLYDVLDNNKNQFGERPALSVDPDGLPGVVYMYGDDAIDQNLYYAKAAVKP
jgi:hypothetical protein